VVNIRSIFYSLCMIIELIFFMYIYIAGHHGAFALQSLRRECSVLEFSCKKLEEEMREVQQSIQAWEKYPFYAEHDARQQLHMGKPHEIWYWYGM